MAIAVLAVAARPPGPARAGRPAAAADGAPAGLVAFFDGDTCPDGWQPAEDVRGRLVIGVPDVASVGISVGAALAPEEDRTHVHTWAAELTLNAKNIAAADGGNDQGAAPGSYAVGGTTDAGTSGLPFVQLLACERP